MDEPDRRDVVESDAWIDALLAEDDFEPFGWPRQRQPCRDHLKFGGTPSASIPNATSRPPHSGPLA
jgi:hypothetical protein